METYTHKKYSHSREEKDHSNKYVLKKKRASMNKKWGQLRVKKTQPYEGTQKKLQKQQQEKATKTPK